ncbi:hypothetical protein [Roseibium sp.]
MTPDTLLSLLGLAMITTVIGGGLLCITATLRNLASGERHDR